MVTVLYTDVQLRAYLFGIFMVDDVETLCLYVGVRPNWTYKKSGHLLMTALSVARPSVIRTLTLGG